MLGLVKNVISPSLGRTNWEVVSARYLLLFVFVAAVTTGRLAGAQEQPKKPEVSESRVAARLIRPSGPYCGLFSLYAFARLNGIDVRPEFLIQQRFISNRQGSSLEDLTKAAEEIGVQAQVVANLSVRSLTTLPYAAILHVKADVFASRNCDHYVLYIPVSQGGHLILDPPNPPTALDYADMLLSWKGTAVLLSLQPIAYDVLFQTNLLRTFVWSLLLVSIGLLLLVFQLLKSHMKSYPSLLAYDGCIILALGIPVAVVFQLILPGGLLASVEATATLSDAYFPHDLPVVAKDELGELVKSGKVVFVDAREPQDYSAGHIADAVNIPAWLKPEFIKDVLTGVPEEQMIVVYCQSKACPYASLIGRRLIHTCGYKNVHLFRGGWNEFVAEHFVENE